METEPQKTDKEITDAIVDKAMAKVRDRKSSTEPRDIVIEARELLRTPMEIHEFARGASELLRQLADEVERLRKCDACDRKAIERACRHHGGKP